MEIILDYLGRPHVIIGLLKHRETPCYSQEDMWLWKKNIERCNIAGFADKGRRPQVKEYGQPPDARTHKGADPFFRASREKQTADTLTSAH